MRSDPFQDLFDKLRAEINEMIDKNASILLALPKVKGQNTYKLSEEDNSLLWKKENSILKQKMNEMLIGPPPTTEQEKFVIIGYLLNIKDQVQ